MEGIREAGKIRGGSSKVKERVLQQEKLIIGVVEAGSSQTS